QSTAPVVTDANGRFSFPNLGTLNPPYRLDFTKRKYKPKTVQPVNSGANIQVELEPGNIQTPAIPRVYSGPRSVRVGWDANPEYNIAGYNVYRRIAGTQTWQRLNSPSSQPYENYIAGLEYEDKTVQPSTLYEYAIQAVSDVDGYTGLSSASEQVKGQFLTVFFPEQVNYNDAGLYLWERNPQNPQQLQVRIPVNSKSVYDVSATSVQIDAELPSGLLLDPNTIDVLPSGITAGMIISANATYQNNKISVRIAAAGVEAGSLYGSGTLFNILASPNLSVQGTQCGPLHLIPDDGAGNGVRLYDVTSISRPLDLELQDGELCVTGGCIHGDADNNKIVEKADAQYVLDYWVKKNNGNECIMKSGDINLDRLVDSADSSLIQRWLAGKDITPPKTKGLEKSYDEYLQDVLWLADAGSLSAEAILADIEKADVTVNVWLSDVLTGTAGTEKTISVLADNVANISGYNMMLNFDKDLAEVVSVQLGNAATGLQLSYNSDVNDSGNLRVSAAGENNIGVKGNGVELLKVRFRMKDDGGNAELVLAQVRINDVYAHVPLFNDPKAPKILKQEPTPEGTQEGTTEGTPEGTTEGETLSKVTVPDVVGKTEAEARSLITSAGLVVGSITREYSDTVPAGKVISQNPPAQTQVNSGSAVNLVVSKGAKPRFIVSCGLNNTHSSYLADIILLSLTSGLLLIRVGRKIKSPFLN
ncbi:MAG: PASTA domain-containing protein, partial [Candidatus Hydrogenedens sp.]